MRDLDTSTPSTGTVPALAVVAWLALVAFYLVAALAGRKDLSLASVGLMAGALVAASGRRVIGGGLALALAAGLYLGAPRLPLLACLPPLAAYLFMAWFFGRTLREGATPFIVQVARREHPDLPADMTRYATALTWAWTLLFSTMFAIALVLAPLMPLPQWSRWVQGMGYIAPALLFLGEFAWRHHRFRDVPHGSLATLVTNIVAVSRDAARGRR